MIIPVLCHPLELNRIHTDDLKGKIIVIIGIKLSAPVRMSPLFFFLEKQCAKSIMLS